MDELRCTIQVSSTSTVAFGDWWKREELFASSSPQRVHFDLCPSQRCCEPSDSQAEALVAAGNQFIAVQVEAGQ